LPEMTAPPHQVFKKPVTRRVVSFSQTASRIPAFGEVWVSDPRYRGR